MVKVKVRRIQTEVVVQMLKVPFQKSIFKIQIKEEILVKSNLIMMNFIKVYKKIQKQIQLIHRTKNIFNQK